MNEPGLFDFIIVNDDLEAAQEQFMQVAQMALAGQDPAEAEEGGLLQPPSGSAPSNETDGAAEVAAEGVPPEGPGEAAESEDSAEAAAADGPGPSLEKVWADVQAGSTHSATTASPAEQSMDWAQKVCPGFRFPAARVSNRQDGKAGKTDGEGGAFLFDREPISPVSASGSAVWSERCPECPT